MKLLVISEFDTQRGSGYTTLTQGLCKVLGERGHQIVIMGLSYHGGPHDLKAAVVPTDQQIIRDQAMVIRAGLRPDAVVLLSDLTWQLMLQFLQNSYDHPFVGIFPIESDPLVHPSEFTNVVDTMHLALCESRFGTKLLNDAGIGARYLPIGVDPFWRPGSAQEVAEAKGSYGLADRFVVLTVADNHERKNLPLHFATIALLAGQEIQWPPLIGKKIKLPRRKQIPEVHFIVNTKRHSIRASGYDNAELTQRFGISDRCLILDHQKGEGLTREQLRELYWAADAFLLLSKAEGLGLPVMEAQACGVPVVGTDAGGIAENAGEGRGFLLQPEWVHIDPFHNQYRRWPSPVAAADVLRRIRDKRPEAHISLARSYISTLTWERTADVFEEAVNAIKSPAPAGREEGGQGKGGGD